MTKTNFKCMHLIDDILYRDLVSKNRKCDHNLSFKPLQYQHPSISKEYFKPVNDEIVNTEEIKSNETQLSKPGPEIQANHSIESKTNKLNNNHDCECMESQKISKGHEKMSGMDTEYKGIDKMMGSDNQFIGINKMTNTDIQDNKIAYKNENQFDSKVAKEFETDVTMKSESDDEQEWQELRQRYNKLRYGSDDDSSAKNVKKQVKKYRKQGNPRLKRLQGKVKNINKLNQYKSRKSRQIPDKDSETIGEIQTMSNQKLGEVSQSPDGAVGGVGGDVHSITRRNSVEGHKMITHDTDKSQMTIRRQLSPAQVKERFSKNGIVSFHCTICNSKFKKFNSLSRHMKNIHGEYFEEWNRKNKRKHENDLSRNKKFKTDGSMKRKSTTDKPDVKRIREEYPCMFCQRYFKSTKSLKRHVENIHGANTNSEKRKRNESTEERYLKRQKTINKVPVSYQNYF